MHIHRKAPTSIDPMTASLAYTQERHESGAHVDGPRDKGTDAKVREGWLYETMLAPMLELTVAWFAPVFVGKG